jgi:hypothetical protein
MPTAADGTTVSWFVRHRLLLLTGLGILVYVPFLGLRDLWYPDEPDIGEVCRAMFLSGDWIAPRRMGVIWVDYPPMIYWAGCIASHLLGRMSELALRLPNALAAIATVQITCLAGSRWFSARTGLWAGATLLTFQHFALEAVSYRPDVLFGLAITAGLLVYAAGAGDRPRWGLRVAGFALLGLAMLCKGPLGLLLPGLVLTLWLGSRREWRRLLELAPLALVSLAVYLPWFVACARAMGSDNILIELYAQNFERYYSGSRGHEKPVYYYLVNFWIDLSPWSWLMPFAWLWTWRSGRWRDRSMQLVLWWVVAFVAFLSFAVTKRQVYLLPAYPAFALLLAPWITWVGHKRVDPAIAPNPRPARVYSGVLAMALPTLAMLLLGLATFADLIVERMGVNEQELQVVQGLRWPLAVTGVVVLGVGLWIGQAWWRRDVRAALARIGASWLLIYVVLQALVLPAFNPSKTYKPQAEWLRERIGRETHFGMYYPGMAYRKMGGWGYYSGKLVVLMGSPEELGYFFERYPGSVVLVHEGSAESAFADDLEGWRARVERKLRTGSHLYLVVGETRSAPRDAHPTDR